ncbi:MAG: cysteine synthase family protein [Verrucomicrobiota bacterium]
MEYFLPGGSIKDRVALRIIQDAEKAGKIKPGDTVIEMTAGNRGIGLAISCARTGYRFIAVMSAGNSPERVRMLNALRAEVELVPQSGASEMGKVSREDMELVKQRLEELARQREAYCADQFNNPSNTAAHESTAQEIWEQTEGRAAAFVAIVGTGGTFTGIARALKRRNPKVKCYVVEPAEAPLLAGHPVVNTRHQLQGAGFAITPGFWDTSLVDGYFAISNSAAVEQARRLGSEHEIVAGYTTGANVAAAMKLTDTLTPNELIVTIACDMG